MDKTWLIRTSDRKILGPVSKAKIKELLDRGILQQDSELCSGNGFWFYVREKEFIDLHIFGDQCQGFNPVSEAKTVLSSFFEGPQTIVEESETGYVLPSAEDLAFPIPEDAMDDITVIFPKNVELEYPDAKETTCSISEIDEPNKLSSVAEQDVQKKNRKNDQKRSHEKKKNDRYLLVVGFILLLFIAMVLYYYKIILNKPIAIGMGSTIFSSAYATPLPDQKKK